MKTAKDRLMDFLFHLGVGQNTFEKNVGISNGYISHNKGSIGSEIISKIASKYPELNTTWLLTGEGGMLKEENLTMNVKKSDDELSLNDLIKAIKNLSEAAVVNANAAMKNAEANERYSKNMEKMLNMLTGERGSFEKKELYQTI